MKTPSRVNIFENILDIFLKNYENMDLKNYLKKEQGHKEEINLDFKRL